MQNITQSSQYCPAFPCNCEELAVADRAVADRAMTPGPALGYFVDCPGAGLTLTERLSTPLPLIWICRVQATAGLTARLDLHSRAQHSLALLAPDFKDIRDDGNGRQISKISPDLLVWRRWQYKVRRSVPWKIEAFQYWVKRTRSRKVVRSGVRRSGKLAVVLHTHTRHISSLRQTQRNKFMTSRR